MHVGHKLWHCRDWRLVESVGPRLASAWPQRWGSGCKADRQRLQQRRPPPDESGSSWRRRPRRPWRDIARGYRHVGHRPSCPWVRGQRLPPLLLRWRCRRRPRRLLLRRSRNQRSRRYRYSLLHTSAEVRSYPAKTKTNHLLLPSSQTQKPDAASCL